jgi:hypothetical protein
MTRWQLSRGVPTEVIPGRTEHNAKVDARVMYLEEQIALTSARLAVEKLKPYK